MKPSRPFKETGKIILSDPKVAALYLEEILADGDTELFNKALMDVAEAQGGVTRLSRKAKLSREALYRTLSRQGNPRLDTLTKVLSALGMRMSVVHTKME